MNASLLDRITIEPGKCGGKPCIRGTRLSVDFILELLASNATRAQIIERYPQLSEADIEQAIRFAADAAANTIVLNRRIA